jgi:hypothetical protein
MSNSSGFGGVNVALIFGARTPAHPADVAR